MVTTEMFNGKLMEGPERPPIVNHKDRKALNILQGACCTKDNKVMAPVLWENETRPQNNIDSAKEHWRRSRPT